MDHGCINGSKEGNVPGINGSKEGKVPEINGSKEGKLLKKESGVVSTQPVFKIGE